MIDRRRFLKIAAVGSAGLLARPIAGLAGSPDRLVILHTNDTHSRIDPFPMDGGRLQGLGGVARRAALVRKIRQQEPHVLLLDSGDIFQGTPYFNYFKGEVEFKAMTAMQYDVSTFGNHDFDNGVEGLVRMLPHAGFRFVNANYDFGDTTLAGHVQPSITFQKGNIKVGVFGLGIDFDGLVVPALHRGITYQDPIPAARKMAARLRQEGCQLVICLSHLGYRYRDDKVSDQVLAKEVDGIDLILGGHTHTFLDKPDVVRKASGTTMINQVGFGGVLLGRIDVTFDSDGRMYDWAASGYTVDASYT